MLPRRRDARRRTTLAFAVLAAGLVSALSAQNLVTNPHFDSGLEGWQQFLNAASWDSAEDAGGSPSSGSARAFVDDPVVTGFTDALGQCVPLTPGITYHLRAKILVPTGQAAAGTAFLLMVPYPTADCSGTPPPSLGPLLQTTPVGPSGAWSDSTASFTSGFARSGLISTSLAPTTGGHFQANFDDVELAEGALGCVADASTLCLLDSRFAITATFDTGHGPTPAHAVPIGDSGLFWFFAAGNIEAVVKVIDGCGVNGKFWFFAAGLTNVKVALDVKDTRTGLTRTYLNPANKTFQPVQDTSAFACP